MFIKMLVGRIKVTSEDEVAHFPVIVVAELLPSSGCSDCISQKI